MPQITSYFSHIFYMWENLMCARFKLRTLKDMGHYFFVIYTKIMIILCRNSFITFWLVPQKTYEIWRPCSLNGQCLFSLTNMTRGLAELLNENRKNNKIVPFNSWVWCQGSAYYLPLGVWIWMYENHILKVVIDCTF